MTTNILLTIATLMQTARIPKVHFIARARLDSLEMESLASISTNADRTTLRQSTVTTRTTAILMLTVPTQTAHSTVHAIRDILAME